MRSLTIAGVLVALAACASTEEKPAAPDAPALIVASGDLDAALAGSWRKDEERARDGERRPKETLAFFGMKPTMSVVEVWPGGGWYTAILAPYLRGGGKLTLAGFSTKDETFRGKFARKLGERLAETPAVYDKVETLPLFMPTGEMDIGEASADMVVTFRNTHNKIRWEGHAPQPYFDAMARALKTGGVLGFVQHRAPEHSSDGESGKIGYLKESLIIRLAENAGLVLEEKSELNANPKDTADYPDGVWTLPPGLRLKDQDRDKYLAIGESDRMTMRFIKPAPGEAVTRYFMGKSQAKSPNGEKAFGPPTPVFAMRTTRAAAGIITETVLDNGKLRTVLLRREPEGARFVGSDGAKSFTGTLDFSEHEAALDAWTYDLKMTDGGGALSGTGSVDDTALRTDKVFASADGVPRVRIVDVLEEIDRDAFWSGLAEATREAPAPQ